MRNVSASLAAIVTIVVTSTSAHADAWQVTETKYRKTATQLSDDGTITLRYECGNIRLGPVENGLEPFSETQIIFLMDGKTVEATGYYEAIVPDVRPQPSFGFAKAEALGRLMAVAKGDIRVRLRGKELIFSSQGSAAAIRAANSKCEVIPILPF